MSTSGEYLLRATRNSLLEDAAEIAGILDPEGGQLSQSQYARLARYLNNMIKLWQADGANIQTRRKVGIVLESGVSSYEISAVGDTDSNFFSETLVETTLTSGSGTALVVGSTTGMSATSSVSGSATYLGIEQTSGTIYWGRISSVDSATGITLLYGGTNYLTGGKVFYHEDPPPRPLKLYDGYIRNSESVDTPIKVLTQEEYNRFGVKTTAGLTTQVFYDMRWPTANVYCYPTVTDVGNVLYLEVAYPFQVFQDSQDLPDFPEEWQQALVYGLAHEIAWRYGMDEKRLAKLEQVANNYRQWAITLSQETSVYLQPMHNMYGQK